MALGGLVPITKAMTRYEMLDVAPDASPDDLHHGYRRMAMLYHPDRHPAEDHDLAEASFVQISHAFQLLSDPGKRARYDQAIESGQEYTESEAGTIDLRDVLRRMEQYESPFDTSMLSGKLSDLNSMVADNLIKEIGEHVMDVWAIDAVPPGVNVQGALHAGAAVLTNVRLLVPFVTQWTTTSGNTKTKHTAQYMVLCALHLTDRIVIEETDKVKSTLKVRFIQHDRTVEFRTKRHNLGKLLLVARAWNIPVQGLRKTDKKRERKWALGPILWLPWIACLYMVGVAAVMYLATEDGLFQAVSDTFKSLYPFGTWVALLFVAWSTYRLRLWLRAYGAMDLTELASTPAVGQNTTQLQAAA